MRKIIDLGKLKSENGITFLVKAFMDTGIRLIIFKRLLQNCLIKSKKKTKDTNVTLYEIIEELGKKVYFFEGSGIASAKGIKFIEDSLKYSKYVVGKPRIRVFNTELYNKLPVTLIFGTDRKTNPKKALSFLLNFYDGLENLRENGLKKLVLKTNTSIDRLEYIVKGITKTGYKLENVVFTDEGLDFLFPKQDFDKQVYRYVNRDLV